MELYIAGGCSEHGRNAFLVRGESLSFLVDCGQMKEKPDEPWPALSDRDIRSLKYLFLTHCHADHTGALPWLLEHGFRGTVCASEETLANIRPFKAPRLVLEEAAPGGEGFFPEDGLRLEWGRSGHCAGSVWFRFSAEGRQILFTGDYQEYSVAYRCDRVRDMYADLAVVDCAYGSDTDDAGTNMDRMMKELDMLAGMKKPMLFPVPSCGRGADVIRLLADRRVPVYLGESLMKELTCVRNPDFWLQEGLVSCIPAVFSGGLNEVIQAVSSAADSGLPWPERLSRAAILVKDSQLWREDNRLLADFVIRAGGRVILTGKQDPSSYARKLLDDGKADFLKISVHQNIDEMLHLLSQNRFRTAVPYHCRRELCLAEKEVRICHTGDTVLF